MSSLPPVGKATVEGAEPATAFGQQGEQFNKQQVDRRKGRADRRAAGQVVGGGRREGEADRRFQAGETVTGDVQTSGEVSKLEPVHLEDDQGRLQPNPKAPVEGVSDIERLQDAVSKGTPLGTVELEERGVPASEVPVVHHVQGSTTERESGDVRAGIGEVDHSEAEKPTEKQADAQWTVRQQRSREAG